MKCRNCGNELTVDMNFCEKCGMPVPKDEEQKTDSISIKKDTMIKIAGAALIAVILIIAAVVFGMSRKNVQTAKNQGADDSVKEETTELTEDYDTDVWDYRLPEPPDHVSQEFFAVFYEKSRDNRIEMSVFDIDGDVNENYIVWSGTGNPLVLYDQSVLRNCDQFYYDGSKWVEFKSGYHRIGDSAKNIISSNLDIRDAKGKMIQPHITGSGISESLDLSQYQVQEEQEPEKEKPEEEKTVEKIYVYPDSSKQVEKIYVYPTEDSTGYILPGSDYRYISESELYGFSELQLRLARNEIYARYGRKFKDQGLQDYFDSCSWYWPSISPGDFKESILNKYEKANVDLISQYEKDMGYR